MFRLCMSLFIILTGCTHKDTPTYADEEQQTVDMITESDGLGGVIEADFSVSMMDSGTSVQDMHIVDSEMDLMIDANVDLADSTVQDFETDPLDMNETDMSLAMAQDMANDEPIDMSLIDMTVEDLSSVGIADWFQTFGGGDHEEVKSVATDSEGNVYVLGNFYGNITFGEQSFVHTEPGTYTPDIFVASYTATGLLRWAQTYGARGGDLGVQIAIDGDDHLYLLGYHHSSLTVGDEILQVIGDNDADIFVISLDRDGHYRWAKNWGGINSESPSALTVNAEGDLFITGSFQGYIAADGLQAMTHLELGGLSEIFVLAIDGETLMARWLTSFSGYGHDVGTALQVSDSGQVALAISYQQDLVISDSITFNSGGLAFGIGLIGIDTNGSINWAQDFFGTGSEEIRGVDIDDQGAIYLTGIFSSEVTLGGPLLSGIEGHDVMLAKFDHDGTHIWSKGYAGNGFDQALGLDVQGQVVYITGRFKQNLSFDDFTLNSPDHYEVFVGAFLTSNGNTLWVDSVGSLGDDQGNSIEASNQGSLFVGGYHRTDVNFGDMNYPPTSSQSNDAYILRYIIETE